jgi:hypothetical protein
MSPTAFDARDGLSLDVRWNTLGVRWNKEHDYLFDLMRSTLTRGLHETQAFDLAAEFYVIQDSSTKRCTVVDKKLTVKTETIIGENGKVYSTREEATTAMGRKRFVLILTDRLTGLPNRHPPRRFNR